MFNTFHAGRWYMRWPLDHLFLSKHFTLRNLRRLPSIGSDHFPLLTTLQYSPENGSGENGPNADADDQARARSKEQQQGVDAADVPKP